MHNVPKQVREQAEESDRLIAEATEAKKPTSEPTEQGKPGEQANKIDPDNYKDRFINYKKSTDITISNLRNEVSQLTGQVEVLSQQNAEFIKQLQDKSVEQVTSTPEVDHNLDVNERIMAVLTDEEKETYSPEFIEMLGRATKAVSQSPDQSSDLESRLNKVENFQQETAEDAFWRIIKEKVPSWKEVQSTDEFQDYLNEYDPLLGTTRMQVLKQAQSDLNAERAVAVFTTHINGSQSRSTSHDEETINPLDKHVVPDLTGSGSGDDIQEVPNLTAEQITQFYIDVSLGRYKTRPAEMESMENAIRKIHAATNQPPPANVDNKETY